MRQALEAFMSKQIQVFEHQPLCIGTNGFSESHFDRLVRYNELHGCKYFDIGHKKIRFKNYVGVIQVGSLVIEILPKADKSRDSSKSKWHQALISMLQRSRMLKLESLSKAKLKLRSSTLLDLYIESFLLEVRRLTHEGLLQMYRQNQCNVSYLKGKLLFSKQFNLNYIHQERFYTEHSIFDRNNIFNGIVKSALSTIFFSSSNPHLSAEAGSLLLNFDNIANAIVTADTFKRLSFNRNTERYRYPIQLAKLILLEYLSDVKGGKDHVLAILFDMNTLFERYVFAELKRVESKFAQFNLKISAQLSRRFWGTKKLRPDIWVGFTSHGKEKVLIMDTKWKSLTNLNPSDDDLRQMYAYNLHFGSNKALLIYPRVNYSKTVQKDFEPSKLPLPFSHGCGLYFAELFDDNDNLRSDFGSVIIRSIMMKEGLDN